MTHTSNFSSITDSLRFGFSSKLTLQRQSEAAECGLACLAMLATYHGYKTDLATLRQRFPFSLKGSTLHQLVEIAAELKLSGRPVKLGLDELKDLALPCILHWDLNHFVVLDSITSKGIVVLDPARGVRTLSIEEVSDSFTGIALQLVPAPGFIRKTERQSIRLRDLTGKVVGLKRSLTQIVILALVLEALSLCAPLFNQWVVDHAIVSGDLNLLWTLAIGFGLLKVIGVVIEAVRGWAVLIMSTTMNVQWLANLFLHLVKLPLDFFEKRHMGDVMSRFNSIHAIQHTVTNSFIAAILDGVMTIGTLTMMLVYSPFLTMIAAAAMLLYLVLRSCFYASLMAASESSIVLGAQQESMFMETIRGMQSLRLFSKEKDRAAKWMDVIVDQKNADLRVQRLTLGFQTGNGLLFGLESIIVLAIGSQMVIANEFSVGMLFAFIAYKTQFSNRVSSLIDKFFELKMLSLQTDRLADIALAKPETDNYAFAHEITSITPSIEVRNLGFSYGIGEKPVFANLSFVINAGEAVAIVGPSGCGKTTLIKILLGIYKPSAGEILIGGIPMRQIGTSSYRKIMASVMQEDTLFAGSIADNISFFDPTADRKLIEVCANMAALHNEIMAMPMGYNTLVGEMGSTLSGGQKQRLMLARALFCRPKFLILDEATSHLDVKNEAAINDIIKKLTVTRIIIAHRKETIASADRVIDMGARPPLGAAPAPPKVPAGNTPNAPAGAPAPFSQETTHIGAPNNATAPLISKPEGK